MALYDRIGLGYDTTRRADPYLLSRLLYHLAPRIRARYLDVGCGTGNYTIGIRGAGVAMCAVDVSATMLRQARYKSCDIAWVNGDVVTLPFRNESFAGATTTFVHHHLKDPVAGFREIRRVLVPGASLILLNGTLQQFQHYWLIEYFPLAMEQAFAPYARLETDQALAAAGLSIKISEPYEVAAGLMDWFLYCGKHKPEMYLDARVRAGISAFACARDQNEITRGVERLAEDTRTGRIATVMRQYAWEGGDYTFTVAVR
jgi:ubiquinone/menaquinone biosynthesis C-methylase UbiE